MVKIVSLNEGDYDCHTVLGSVRGMYGLYFARLWGSVAVITVEIKSLGQFLTVMDLRCQAIFIRMSCNVGKCKLHGSATCICNRRSQFDVVMEIWAKVINCTVTKFVNFVHISLEINFSCYLSTGIDFPMTWSRFLIITEFLLEVCASRYRKNCTFIFLKYREVFNRWSYTSPILGLLSSGFQRIFRAYIVAGHIDAMGCIWPCKGVYFMGCSSYKISICFHDLAHVACSMGRRQSEYMMGW